MVASSNGQNNLGELEESSQDAYASLGAREAIIRLNQIRDNDSYAWDTYDKICFNIAIAELEDVVVACAGCPKDCPQKRA